MLLPPDWVVVDLSVWVDLVVELDTRELCVPTLVTGPLDVTEDEVEASTGVVVAVVVEVVTCVEPEATYHRMGGSQHCKFIIIIMLYEKDSTIDNMHLPWLLRKDKQE